MDAGAWDERYAGRELVWSLEPNAFVAQECSDLPPGRALDVACGEGRNALWLAGRGWRVTAADFSAAALEKGRALAAEQEHGDRVTWQRADATTWSPPAGQDLVVLAYLQLDDEQRRAAVRSAYDALRPGGTFLLVAHDRSNLAEGTGGPQDPTVLMTAEDVLADLADRAPDVVRAGRVAREVPPHGTHTRPGEAAATAWDCLVRCVRT
ncbi:class I SAM-dependent methyltransferase [Nocardioides sp. AX2bis]|uniref:class I SAM-dependent methyltransferase n=1 Tax=Nocardioides sp. AX2bis TaxID=2653157 RepID=UPI0012F29E02|nr:class I SAM-dependent methyltransferase [Nocardioides sp. AX2bis]VXC05372.1 Thioredoxin reductase [Nocardioides sp. AX2bis]